MASKNPARATKLAGARAAIAALRGEVAALRQANEAIASDLAALRAALATGGGAPLAAGEAHMDALRYLVMAAEYKDHDTGAHLVRIGYFSALLAPVCGCDDEWTRLILLASPMHDVGKIGIPDRILKKATALSVEERRVMERHAEYGANILAGSDAPVLQLASEIALTHHECYDGSGYPRGLKGDAIPLSGRIVAVADVFDALVMDRAYRPALPPERALELVREGRGRHFDPDVVDAFFSVIEPMLDLRERINRGELPGEFPGAPEGFAGDPLGFYEGPLHSTPPDGERPHDDLDYYYR